MILKHPNYLEKTKHEDHKYYNGQREGNILKFCFTPSTKKHAYFLFNVIPQVRDHSKHQNFNDQKTRPLKNHNHALNILKTSITQISNQKMFLESQSI